MMTLETRGEREKPTTRVAIAQAAPIFGDLGASLDKAVEWCQLAADAGTELIVFPETWLPGYPAWLDIAPDTALWDHRPTQEVYASLRRNSLAVPSPEASRLSATAKEFKMVIAMGVNERVDVGPGNRTLYNSILIWDADGELINHHRKLVPTYSEKLVWGAGDGHGVKAVPSAAGRLGALVCWEHWMPMPRQRLHDQGEQIHIAMWPTVKELHQVASRHYAFEGRCFVIAAGSILRASELPQELPLSRDISPEDLVMRGGSSIIGPDGEYVLEPLFDEEDLRICDLDLTEIDRQALTLDTSGHYARRDVFSLGFNPGPPRRDGE